MPTPPPRRARMTCRVARAARSAPRRACGRPLALGLAVSLLAALAFGVLAAAVMRGAAITGVDLRLAHWFHARATPGLTRAMLFVTDWNSLAGSSVMAALLALWFWRRRLRDWLLLVAVAVPGGMLLNVLLKHLFQRPRPRFDDPLLRLETYSFPSGHTAAATVFYGLLAWWLMSRARGRAARAALFAAAAAMVCLVALSRVYLGVHYLSDVLAAVLESCAWLALCIGIGATVRRARRRPAGEGA